MPPDEWPDHRVHKMRAQVIRYLGTAVGKRGTSRVGQSRVGDDNDGEVDLSDIK